ncbi:uncharacterized protein LOC106167388 [Lingula anatina]|uniref:Uncharacterized protein LOC106167388 n=1 Tax=Lingula anatina TaxID=7574 RepID=A0A1S3IVQ8_LINAN|nr:uncharacterized protein LOC106167388 [Lingula anatina]|eukprot:XP_013401629.1 uncharacterized protein LOC106167388 [Lingula anatina]
MKTLVAIAVVVTLFPVSFSARLTPDIPPKECRSSSECGRNSCCRDESGAVVGRLDSGSFGDLLLGGGPGSAGYGLCSNELQQKGEVCDPSTCSCGEGLECYRPMSGVCCLPHRCYDAEWVAERREYWRNCFSNPKCHLPA